MHIYMHAYIHPYIHTHTHTYTHTCIHTYKLHVCMYIHSYIHIICLCAYLNKNESWMAGDSGRLWARRCQGRTDTSECLGKRVERSHAVLWLWRLVPRANRSRGLHQEACALGCMRTVIWNCVSCVRMLGVSMCGAWAFSLFKSEGNGGGMWCVLQTRLKCIHEYIGIKDSHVYVTPRSYTYTHH